MKAFFPIVFGRRIVSALIVSGVAASPVLAQSAPPSPNLGDTPPVWLGYLLIFVLLVALVVVSLWPSKRSHQD